MSDNVIQLASVKPKTLNKQYKNQKYKLEFIVDTNQWKWTVYIITQTQFSDIAPTLIAAQKAAEKHIDSTLRIKNK
ncbi:MAG: hypothetical protein IM561_09070 [Microcystis sp. M60BS1]|uniref:hypothetical protein n=1 Tax=unclassified Microcystis TaxID=2643300 RepID=UPI00257E347F|nr:MULTISPECIES: hypothetical protein [unclassified Microcystis]MCA2594357.1 hypothetical protein [Microcystis sp. M38BS1]MCA6581466.1 hypothetical protein [Pseudanabaena sp. M34BS1SP1A06MG]MCA2510520.1 hypothetical protein [Microcystis sp. M60BS1]MCA2555754.1 hypothetical protein [Microcystis sp. M43BS1]MCA2603417.1 hypothetical protein [Microcystis sp. M26BS1]